MGAWIETYLQNFNKLKTAVAPLVGAWIETKTLVGTHDNEKSHPSWVRGLKRFAVVIVIGNFLSHHSWVRGLKQRYACSKKFLQRSHPSWVRGLKHLNKGYYHQR